MDARGIVEAMLRLHPLDRVPRAGYLLRGVTEPESVAAHGHGVALLTLLVCEAYPGRYDRGRALSMALIHDVQEAATMDIPLGAGDPTFHRARSQAEREAFRDLLGPAEGGLLGLFDEYSSGLSPEARLVRELDKVQMMIKVLGYQGEGRGRLEEFWEAAEGLGREESAVRELMDALYDAAGRPRPPRARGEAAQ